MPHYPKPFFRKSRRLWYVQLDGKQINLGPDRDAAFQQYYALMAQPRETRRVPSESVAALCDCFLEWVQRHRSPETYEWYRYRLQRFIERYPDLLVSQLRPYHVENWVDSYSFSVTSRRNYLRSIKRCMKWAAKMGYIESNPIAHLEVPTGESKEQFVPLEEFHRLISYVRSQTLEDLVVVTYETGCRPQESLRVEARHVDLANQRWVFPQSEAKTKKMPRVVYLTATALQITRRLVLAHPTGPLFRNTAGRPWTTDAVNCGFQRLQVRMGKEEMRRQGMEVSEDAIRDFIPSLKKTRLRKGIPVDKTAAELREEAKIKLTQRLATTLAPHYSLYALRHSWATNALQRGVDSLTVAILMGHQDPSTLARVYQHLSHNPKHLLEQAQKAAG